ncbi:MAG: OmpA family protein [Pseudomonadota bacterium]
MTASDTSTPVFSRRAFIAAALSGGVAAGAAALAGLGWLSAPQSSSFAFSRGTSLGTGEEARLRAFLAPALEDDRLHVTIIGHTGQTGEAAANQALSEARAEAGRTIALALGLAPEQITTAGLGGAAPLSKAAEESDRAFQSRLARIDVSLQPRR